MSSLFGDRQALGQAQLKRRLPHVMKLLNRGRHGEPLFSHRSYLGAYDAAAPAGSVNGISGWITQQSLRQVGITVEGKY